MLADRVAAAARFPGAFHPDGDLAATRAAPAGRRTDVSAMFHAGTSGVQFQSDGTSGPDPDDASCSPFATFSDPDGNGCCKA